MFYYSMYAVGGFLYQKHTVHTTQQYPQNVANAFYASLPSGTFWPMFIFATLATVVASQALISAVFSIIMQAIAQVGR